MSRNGSGTYNLPAGNPVITGTTITTTWANTTLNDIAASLTGSVAADGQTPMSGSLNMANNKITAISDPVNAQDAATKAYVDASIPSTSDFLTKTNNLSDVSNVTTSRTNLSAAKSGANSDITSLTGITTPLTVSQGGIGAATLTANNVLLGNGTSAPQFVAPGTSGNVLTSNGTTWTSVATAYAGLKSQIFTSSGTFTVPSSITAVKITLLSGGGGGGGGANNGNVAGNGTNGGTTSFGTLISQTGQNGGNGANNTGPTGGGASGGTPGGNYILTTRFSNVTKTINYSTGGDGGIGGNYQPVDGGGGASGSPLVGYLTVTSGTSYTVTVGAAGTGGGPNGGAATAGSAGTAGYLLVEW